MSEYKSNPVTVDAILEKDGHVLLIRRQGRIFNNYLALPGGFVDYEETVEDAVVREVQEELNLDMIPHSILGVYSGTDRDPRGPIISVVFVGSFTGDPTSGDDASAFEYIRLEDLENEILAFDHNKILSDYLSWKKTKGTFWTAKT